jgi:hypothetical protein
MSTKKMSPSKKVVTKPMVKQPKDMPMKKGKC